MRLLHLTGSFSRPADATAYAAADIIANSGTGALVVPITFTVPDAANVRSGRITGARCTVAPASGNMVIVAADFDLLLFRPQTDIPFAAAGYPADNAALTLTAAMYRELVGFFPFVNGAWRNQLGSLVAGTVGYQAVGPQARVSYPFSLHGLTGNALLGIVQAKAAWTPGAVVNQLDFTLDLEQD